MNFNSDLFNMVLLLFIPFPHFEVDTEMQLWSTFGWTMDKSRLSASTVVSHLFEKTI